MYGKRKCFFKYKFFLFHYCDQDILHTANDVRYYCTV